MAFKFENLDVWELAKKLSAFKNYLKRDSVNESEQDYNF
jgi:hypothetical protein